MTAEIRHITPSFRKIVVSTNARSNITLEQFIVISILERIVEMLSSVYLTIVTRCLRQREPDCRGVFVTPVNDRMLADEWEEVSHHLLISLLRTNLSTGAKLRLLGACHHSRTRPEQRKLTNNNELLRRLRSSSRRMLDPNITLEQFIIFSILERIVEMLFSVYLTIVTRCLRQREPEL